MHQTKTRRNYPRNRVSITLQIVKKKEHGFHSSLACLLSETRQAALSAAEAGVKEADDASAAVLGGGGDGNGDSGDDTDDGMRLRAAPARASSASGVKEEDLRSLESTVKKAKTAGSTVPQVRCGAVWFVAIRGDKAVCLL